MNKFQEVLVAFYEDWRKGRADEKSVSDFSRWVGIAPAVMHNYMKGRRKPDPGSKELKALEVRLGGAVYDALDLPRPAIRAAMAVLSELTEEDQTDTISSIIFRAKSSELSPEKKADIKEMEDYIRQRKKEKGQKKNP
jgi:outer membrane protein OmpA-like peptidoglycan-associated protein